MNIINDAYQETMQIYLIVLYGRRRAFTYTHTHKRTAPQPMWLESSSSTGGGKAKQKKKDIFWVRPCVICGKKDNLKVDTICVSCRYPFDHQSLVAAAKAREALEEERQVAALAMKAAGKAKSRRLSKPQTTSKQLLSHLTKFRCFDLAKVLLDRGVMTLFDLACLGLPAPQPKSSAKKGGSPLKLPKLPFGRGNTSSASPSASPKSKHKPRKSKSKETQHGVDVLIDIINGTSSPLKGMQGLLLRDAVRAAHLTMRQTHAIVLCVVRIRDQEYNSHIPAALTIAQETQKQHVKNENFAMKNEKGFQIQLQSQIRMAQKHVQTHLLFNNMFSQHREGN